MSKTENKGMELQLGELGMSIRDIFWPIFATDREKCTGPMALSTREVGQPTDRTVLDHSLTDSSLSKGLSETGI